MGKRRARYCQWHCKYHEGAQWVFLPSDNGKPGSVVTGNAKMVCTKAKKLLQRRGETVLDEDDYYHRVP